MANIPPQPAPAFYNPFPIHLQIRQIIERRLYAECELGDKLPTEEALRAEFGVSRETIREALRGLEEEGVIRRYRAKGTFFVSRPDKCVEVRATGMVEDCALRADARAELLSDMPADPETWLLERLYCLDERPLAVQEIYLPRQMRERLEICDLACTPLKTLAEQRLSVSCTEESRHVDAIVADARLARLLDIPVGAPVLKITRAHRLGDLAMRALSYSYYRADRYYYTTALTAPY
jgi:GntR family transcriptional regulator